MYVPPFWRTVESCSCWCRQASTKAGIGGGGTLNLGGGGRDKGQSSFVFVSAAIELMAVLAHSGPDINGFVQYAWHLMSSKNGFGQNQPEIQSRNTLFQKTFILKFCSHQTDGGLGPTINTVKLQAEACVTIQKIRKFPF